MENLKLLFRLYVRPADAMSDIIDRGSWVFAAMLVLVVSIVFFWTTNVKLHETYRIPDISEYYNPETERKNITDILIKKHRNGPVGNVEIYFERDKQRFRSLDKKHPDPFVE